MYQMLLEEFQLERYQQFIGGDIKYQIWTFESKSKWSVAWLLTFWSTAQQSSKSLEPYLLWI